MLLLLISAAKLRVSPIFWLQDMEPLEGRDQGLNLESRQAA